MTGGLPVKPWPMSKKNRDEFTEKTKLQVAKRAGWLCSDPSCRRPTIGSNSDGDGEINVGVAAHICAATPAGPRYDATMTREERRSPDNGIWLCQLHAKAVDAKDSQFTVARLREWKIQAQMDSWRRVLDNDVLHVPVSRQPSEREMSARLHAAAAADLRTFHRSSKWPSTTIPLTLEVDGLNEPLSTAKLATVLTTLDDLILIAQPGMGKTTTVFQIAEAVLANGNASPIVVSLGDWSADGASLLEAVLKRPAFRGISEDDLRSVAAKPGVILLLDGWNELDSDARQRARTQVSCLQMEHPELSLLITTRKQARDVPINGTRVSLQPLSETQQIDIARELHGDAGERMVDQAWRTDGVRELVTTPLYLTVLLALPEGSPFPTTKEEVLRRFVAVHEEDIQRPETLAQVTHGLHQRFLEDLAATATRSANTTITEPVARKSVFDTDNALETEGQITEKPQPHAVLEAFVNHHVLVRVEDPAGYSFQHQQFQEWYASHYVERLMVRSLGDHDSREALKADVLNQRPWEEAIFFACERLSRGTKQQQAACGAAVLAAFYVDPILAAEMIQCSTDAVWASVGPRIQGLMARWHVPGTVDRAFRFMITSGRQEFLEHVWPLITHENRQVHLAALSASSLFQPSLFGPDGARRLKALPPNLRKTVLYQIAMNSGMAGLDLVADVAQDDPVPEVRASVVDALAFRYADRHVTQVLRDADEKTFDLLANKGLINEVTDGAVKAGLAAARERCRLQENQTYNQIASLVDGPVGEAQNAELATVIAEMEIGEEQEGAVQLIYVAKNRFPLAVTKGILSRLREGRKLPYNAAELIAGSGCSLEDEALLNIALGTNRFDDRANAAASVLGPQAVGRLIDRMFELKEMLEDTQGPFDEAVGDRYHAIRYRIGYTHAANLLAAIAARSDQANNQRIANLADLISIHPDGENRHGKPFDAAARDVIAGFVEDWGNRLLNLPDATRAELAAIARLSHRSPSASLLPLLKRLLDEDLRRWRAFKEQARADHSCIDRARDEARTPWSSDYQWAFQAIGCSETVGLMAEYLLDEDFGNHAALVLAKHWRDANEPNEDKQWRRSPDFSSVAEKRTARESRPLASSVEADTIFCAIERLLGEDSTEDEKKRAVALAIVAAALPHGQRGDVLTTLIGIAEREPRRALLTNLVLSGEVVDVDLVKQGIGDMFEAAKTQPWILDEPYQLRMWLSLLPFTNRPSEAVDIVQALPEQHRTVSALEEMLTAFGFAPGDDAENVLFHLAGIDPRLYENHAWHDAVIRRGTLSSAKHLVDLVAGGVFHCKDGSDQRYMSTRLAGLIGEHSDLRAHVYDLLKNYPLPETALLVEAVAENADEYGLLLLIQLEIEHKGAFVSRRTIERVVNQYVPVESGGNTYNVLPVATTELRRQLLAMTTDAGPSDFASHYLNQIDKIRDDYGTPESEPRHPDLASGKLWPIISLDPNAKTECTDIPPNFTSKSRVRD